MKFYILFILSVTLLSCSLKAQIEIPHNHSAVKTMGRVLQDSNKTRMFWPGSSVKLYFKGQEISAVLQDEKGENYYSVTLDNKKTFRFKVTTEKETYLLFDNLKDTIHSVEVSKRTEYTNGYTDFYAFILKDSAPLLTSPPERNIAFYGNSISTGYAVGDFEGKDRPDSIYTNHCKAFPYLVAKELEANHTCTCRSGIGISVSWFPLIMPELYNRLDPNDPKSSWDFQQDYADVVVVNLLQNDSWIIEKRKHPAYTEQFGHKKIKIEDVLEDYNSFIKKLRTVYPESHIVCMLGNMDITAKSSKWPHKLQQSITELNDKNVSVLIAPYKNTAGHPNEMEQERLAMQLSTHIKAVKNW